MNKKNQSSVSATNMIKKHMTNNIYHSYVVSSQHWEGQICLLVDNSHIRVIKLFLPSVVFHFVVRNKSLSYDISPANSR